MMEAADWDRVFVADLAAERAGLSKANVVRFGGRAAADDAGLRRDEFAVLLVAQTDGLRLEAASDDCRCRSGRLEDRRGLCFASACSLLGLPTASDIPAPTCPSSIAASRSRKLASTVSASAGVKVFFAGRFLWTQSAASSADLRSAELGDQSVAQRF